MQGSETTKKTGVSGPYVAFFVNQKGVPFEKGYPSPFLRQKAITKLKFAGVKCTGQVDYY